MAKVTATLTVTYIFEVDAYGVPNEDDARTALEEAYADGELGIVDDHEFSDITVES